MRAIAGYLILLAIPLAALAVVLPANVYRARCRLVFALPVVLIYGVGALPSVPNITEAVHELHRNDAGGEFRR
ncbi:hypothetical protein [Rhizobium etli]|uniref:hypothetical protein n=1 Tax=Rhizobium etli TaxID=29449 RepID=UPI0005700B5C|nr:hypothetical protein [Rhizobium sp. IE4771]